MPTEKRQTNVAAQKAAISAKDTAAKATAAAQAKAASSAVAAAKALTEKLNAATGSLQSSKGATLSIPKAISDIAEKTSATAKQDIAAYKTAQETEANIVIPAAIYEEVPTNALALDTFINTLSLIFGTQEASKPYVSKLYELVSGFYKTGSTIDESLNLALRAAKEQNAIPEFTDRFKGLFALDEMKKAGKAVTVPTIAEFFATEAKMGEILTNAGLGDLATESFIGDNIIGKNKSVLEVGNLISDVFTAIDNAPTALKTDLQTYFPGVDRVSMAKAILMGPEGAAQLAQKVKGITVQSAASTQGLNVDLATAQDIASMGYGYNQALQGFGQVASALPTYEKLQEIQLGTDVKSSTAQAELQKSVFGQNIAEQEKIKKLGEQEAARFRGTAGILGSKALASQSRAAGLI